MSPLHSLRTLRTLRTLTLPLALAAACRGNGCGPPAPPSPFATTDAALAPASLTALPSPAALPPDACTGVGNPVGVALPPGFCLRPVATGLQRPRGMVFGPSGELIVAESGPGWRPNRGAVSVLTRQPDGTFRGGRVVERVDRPHGIALRDGRVYVAESGRIARFAYPLADAGAPRLETVVRDLPASGRHDHKTLAFGPDGALYFSIGSATDNCAPPGLGARGEEPCHEAEGTAPAPAADAGAPADARASAQPAVQRAVVARWDPRTRRFATVARGLRNNLGLAWHPASGRLYGVDNSRDYIQRVDPALADAALPHDELNELTEGGDYGWPYCYDARERSPEYPDRAAHCRERTRAPTLLLPAHAAPISIVFYQGAMFPARYRGRAFITYHGYRATGHRVVTVPFGDDGRPAGEPEDFVSAWDERPGRPHGHLMGLTEGPDGALYLSDDVAGTIYVIAYGRSALGAAAAVIAAAAAEDPAVVAARCRALDAARGASAFAALERDVLDVKCVPCHEAGAGGLSLRMCDAAANHAAITSHRSDAYGALVVPGRTDAGLLFARLRGEAMGPRMPPAPIELAPAELAAFEAWVRAGATR